MKVQRPKPRSKRGQNIEMRKRRDWAGQWPPRAGRGRVHGPWWWGAQSCALVVRGCLGVFAWLFVFRRFLLCFCFIIPMYVDLMSTQFIPNTLHSHPLSFPRVLELILERKRGSGEDLRGFHTGFDRDFQNAFWLSFSFPSPLFSQSNFMLCNFAFIL